ncbi:chemoreceptor glutamine deamidase CheD [Pseudomonas cavernae]|uniref:Probable chemoreceptor glutamine deamidase CheD n=1 Tax=Pseudomonas cavernae TaxID=2320867 RepID=A0A385Z371_9PSED|nr:chemoreceptor glutamine deamidase CheD [Pseudomonas cavernae]AYC32587.1 chemoreceptor glutamine deamidase CheD [Pseudomonas cavernae]
MIIEQPSALAQTRYYDPYFASEAVKILPGEYYATGDDQLIVTVLGSCVSVCLRDRCSGIGGMNHFMLPGQVDGYLQAADSARYGVFAMELLINLVLRLGAQREQFEAKVFGGGCVLPDMTENDVGQHNVAFVHDYLHAQGIPVLAEDVLGNHPRKVYYFPANGRVLVKTLRRLHNSTLLEREQELDLSIQRAALTGPIDLF